MKSCYYSTDTFLFAFEEQQVKMNRIVPFIFSVGNHDVGFNSMADYNITVSDEDGPYYFSYFPQRFKDEDNQSGIPEIRDRYTYNHHVISHLVLFGLDSGYVHAYDGPQMDWLLAKLQQHGQYHFMGHYHVPIYPTCMSNGSFMFSWQQQL